MSHYHIQTENSLKLIEFVYISVLIAYLTICFGSLLTLKCQPIHILCFIQLMQKINLYRRAYFCYRTFNQTNHPSPLRPESFSAAFHNRLLRCCIPHHEEVIRLYQTSYIRELFRMLANGTDRKLNSHVDISSRRITWNAKLCVDFLIQCCDVNNNGLICSETM